MSDSLLNSSQTLLRGEYTHDTLNQVIEELSSFNEVEEEPLLSDDFDDEGIISRDSMIDLSLIRVEQDSNFIVNEIEPTIKIKHVMKNPIKVHFDSDLVASVEQKTSFIKVLRVDNVSSETVSQLTLKPTNRSTSKYFKKLIHKELLNGNSSMNIPLTIISGAAKEEPKNIMISISGKYSKAPKGLKKSFTVGVVSFQFNVIKKRDFYEEEVRINKDVENSNSEFDDDQSLVSSPILIMLIHDLLHGDGTTPSGFDNSKSLAANNIDDDDEDADDDDGKQKKNIRVKVLGGSTTDVMDEIEPITPTKRMHNQEQLHKLRQKLSEVRSPRSRSSSRSTSRESSRSPSPLSPLSLKDKKELSDFDEQWEYEESTDGFGMLDNTLPSCHARFMLERNSSSKAEGILLKERNDAEHRKLLLEIEHENKDLNDRRLSVDENSSELPKIVLESDIKKQDKKSKLVTEENQDLVELKSDDHKQEVLKSDIVDEESEHASNNQKRKFRRETHERPLEELFEESNTLPRRQKNTEKRNKFTNVWIYEFSPEWTSNKLKQFFITNGICKDKDIISLTLYRPRNGTPYCLCSFDNYKIALAATKLHKNSRKGNLSIQEATGNYSRFMNQENQLFTRRCESYTLFLKNFSAQLTDGKLKKHLECYGLIHRLKIARDFSGASKRFGYCCFKNSEDADECLANPPIINSEKLFVSQFKSDAEHSEANELMLSPDSANALYNMMRSQMKNPYYMPMSTQTNDQLSPMVDNDGNITTSINENNNNLPKPKSARRSQSTEAEEQRIGESGSGRMNSRMGGRTDLVYGALYPLVDRALRTRFMRKKKPSAIERIASDVVDKIMAENTPSTIQDLIAHSRKLERVVLCIIHRRPTTEQRTYVSEERQLQEMGFTDSAENFSVLLRCRGDIAKAINFLS
eukprot:TRINITY_DN5390_c0_g1_i1.p1 TRINITY_DN5390_c0_g1~~TRINITY_DN5390_c0_g1_i1.p1  ORF type:complete len:919 (+),score=228.41 TRINITY_DN5390_c0_g1_i1:113-2869(+)